jgi:hypothetical protein
MKPSTGLLIGGALLFACATACAQPPPEPKVPSAAQRVPNPRVDAPDGAVSGEPANEALPGDRPVPLPGNPAGQLRLDAPGNPAAGIPGNPAISGPVNPAGPPPVNPAGTAPRDASGPPPIGGPGAGGSR